MNKQEFDAWAAGESLGAEMADVVWQTATAVLAFPSQRVVEAAMQFVITEYVELKTMPNAGLLKTDYGTVQKSDYFLTDTALVTEAVNRAFTDDDFVSILAFRQNGSYVTITRDGLLVRFAVTDQTGTFTFTLREIKPPVVEHDGD